MMHFFFYTSPQGVTISESVLFFIFSIGLSARVSEKAAHHRRKRSYILTGVGSV